MIKKPKNTHSEIPFSAETILQGMPELAYVFDKEGRMIMWNKNIELILGYSEQELHHKYISEFINEADREKTLELFYKIFAEGKQQTIEYHLVTKFGVKLPYIGSGSLAVVDGKEYLIGQAININKLKEVEESLRSQIDETKKLRNQLEAENIYLRKEIKSQHDFEDIIGESEPLMHTLYRIEQVASINTTVLLEGETGTGKELFAMAIHS